jgi:uncharacterized protein
MSQKVFRVLSIDGGGMRGLYSAAYLHRLTQYFAKKDGLAKVDIGKGFDLIVGTSTGGILATSLFAGTDLAEVMRLYQQHGKRIFPAKILMDGWLSYFQAPFRACFIKCGSEALKAALTSQFQSKTLGEVYAERKIALCIPAINLRTHKAWIFKTPHWEASSHRDDGYKLVDICMATSAAPVYLPVACVDDPNDPDQYNLFIDGGLWANNPVLVALVEAQRCTTPDTEIQIFCLDTAPPPSGESINRSGLNRGLIGWLFGKKVAELNIDAQKGFDDIANMLCAPEILKRKCTVYRLPRAEIPCSELKHFSLDATAPKALEIFVQAAHASADIAHSLTQSAGNAQGDLIRGLFSHIVDVNKNP